MSHHAANVLRWRPDWCFLISINTEVGYENVAAKKASTRLAFFVCATLVVIEWHDNNKKALLRGRLKRNRPSSEFFWQSPCHELCLGGIERECEKAQKIRYRWKRKSQIVCNIVQCCCRSITIPGLKHSQCVQYCAPMLGACKVEWNLNAKAFHPSPRLRLFPNMCPDKPRIIFSMEFFSSRWHCHPGRARVRGRTIESVYFHTESAFIRTTNARRLRQTKYHQQQRQKMRELEVQQQNNNIERHNNTQRPIIWEAEKSYD